MVSLTEIYNIKESEFKKIIELKSDRNPARGNKGKSDEKDYYFIDEPADPETGAIRSKVVYKRSLSKMFEDLYAEAQDFEKLTEDEKYKDDLVLYNISEELKEIIKTFRTHLRKKYPEEHRKINERELEEMNTTGGGSSFNVGDSMGHYGKRKKKIREDEEETQKISPDVQAISKILTRINTKDEWVQMFELLMNHLEEIDQITSANVRTLLQQSLKEI
jgi:hypothetical protein